MQHSLVLVLSVSRRIPNLAQSVRAGSARLGINEESLGLALSALGIGFSPGWRRRRIPPWPSWLGTGLRTG